MSLKRKASCLDDYEKAPINKIYDDLSKIDMRVKKLKKKLGPFAKREIINDRFEKIKRREEELLPKKLRIANVHYNMLKENPDNYWELYIDLVKVCKNIDKIVIEKANKDCDNIEKMYLNHIQTKIKFLEYQSNSRLLSSGSDSEE